MDAQDVKLLNGLSLDDTSQDETIELLIDKYLKVAEEYCNQTFDREHIPSSVEKFIANCIQHGTTGNVSSRTMGTVSYSFVTDLPDETYSYLKPFRRLRWSGYHV